MNRRNALRMLATLFASVGAKVLPAKSEESVIVGKTFGRPGRSGVQVRQINSGTVFVAESPFEVGSGKWVAMQYDPTGWTIVAAEC